MSQQEHPFGWKALSHIVIVAGVLFLVWKLSLIVADIFIALLLASALYPLVIKANKKIPLPASVFLVLLCFTAPIVSALIYFVPTILDQLPELAQALDTTLKQLNFLPEAALSFDPYAFISNNIASLSASVISIAAHTAIILTLTFYCLLDSKRLLAFFINFFSVKYRRDITKMLLEINEVNRNYIRGNIIISIILTVTITLVMLFLGIPYAVPLGIFAGIMDLFPIVGSIIGALPALIIAFSLSPVTGGILLVVNLVYQQIENSIISPMVYKKTLDISSGFSFLAVVVGASLFGPIGAFVALPVAVTLSVMLSYRERFGLRVA